MPGARSFFNRLVASPPSIPGSQATDGVGVLLQQETPLELFR